MWEIEVIEYSPTWAYVLLKFVLHSGRIEFYWLETAHLPETYILVERIAGHPHKPQPSTLHKVIEAILISIVFLLAFVGAWEVATRYVPAILDLW